MNKDHEFAAQLREQVQLGMAEFLKATGAKHGPPVDLSETGQPPLAGREIAGPRPAAYMARKQSLYNKAASGAQLDGMFATVGDFFQAVRAGRRGPAVPRRREAGRAAVARSRRSRTLRLRGPVGWRVPDPGDVPVAICCCWRWRTRIVRPRATVIPMGSLTLPIPTVDDTSHVTTVFGGIETYWADEATAPTESQRQVPAGRPRREEADRLLHGADRAPRRRPRVRRVLRHGAPAGAGVRGGLPVHDRDRRR